MLPFTSPEKGSPCLPSLSFLEPGFDCVVHPFLSMPRSDSPLSRQGAALAHLDTLPSYDMVLWTDGSFPFSKGDSGVLSNCSLGGTETTLSFSAVVKNRHSKHSRHSTGTVSIVQA